MGLLAEFVITSGEKPSLIWRTKFLFVWCWCAAGVADIGTSGCVSRLSLSAKLVGSSKGEKDAVTLRVNSFPGLGNEWGFKNSGILVAGELIKGKESSRCFPCVDAPPNKEVFTLGFELIDFCCSVCCRKALNFSTSSISSLISVRGRFIIFERSGSETGQFFQ